jgi:hypothetical protein
LELVINHANLLRKNDASKEIHYLPFSVDTNKYRKLKIPKRNQILAAFTTRVDFYPHRRLIQLASRSLKYHVVFKRVVVHEGLIQGNQQI